MITASSRKETLLLHPNQSEIACTLPVLSGTNFLTTDVPMQSYISGKHPFSIEHQT